MLKHWDLKVQLSSAQLSSGSTGNINSKTTQEVSGLTEEGQSVCRASSENVQESKTEAFDGKTHQAAKGLKAQHDRKDWRRKGERRKRKKRVPIKNENQIRGTQTNWPGLWTLTGHKRNDLLKATHNTQRHTSQTLKWFGFALGEPVMSSTQSENSSFTCEKRTHFYYFGWGGGVKRRIFWWI